MDLIHIDYHQTNVTISDCRQTDVVHYDCDPLIISYILNTNENGNYYRLKRLYYIFGRSQYRNFLIQCKNYFFNNLFKIYNINTINELIKIKIKRGTVRFFSEYIHFKRHLTAQKIHFNKLGWRARMLVRYLCLYYGYLYIFNGKEYCESLGYKYTEIHEDPRYQDQSSLVTSVRQPLTYRFLKSNRIHNLDYYDMVLKGSTIYDSTFRLKKDVCIYKIGTTKEYHHYECIKVF